MANQQCKGTLHEWRHSERVVGASALFKTLPRSFLVRADEGFSYEVKITRPTQTRRLTGATGVGEAAHDLLFKLPRLRHGSYRVTVTLRAETNQDRVTSFTAARVTPDGRLDPTFGSGGWVTFGFDAGTGAPLAVVAQPVRGTAEQLAPPAL